jgi:hypothetical protein
MESCNSIDEDTNGSWRCKLMWIKFGLNGIRSCPIVRFLF